MKENSMIVLSIIGALAVIAAINPTMQAYAQDEGNTVTAFQSNSVTVDISQSAQTGGETLEETSGDGETDQGGAVSGFGNENDGGEAVSGFGNEDDGDVSQGFCLQINQQNAAAGNEATNGVTNEIRAADCS